MTTSIPIYQAKADLFRTLGHPVRIRVLELLQEKPMPVRDLLADLQVESSSLSQQLAVLRRAGLVTSPREGTTVVASVSTDDRTAARRGGQECVRPVRHRWAPYL